MKRLLLPLLAAISLPVVINAESASRYKASCHDYPCTKDELTAMNLVNDNYGQQLENRLINNIYYPHPWYFISKERDCIFTVHAKEDMPTHTAHMETFTVDICNKTIKATWLPNIYREIK